MLPLASLCRSGQTRTWSLSWQNTAVRKAKLPPLDCKYTIGATFCFPELNCASLAARVGEYILNCLAVEQAERPIFTNVQLPSAISLFKTEALLQSSTHLHSMLHTGGHHNIMQVFQRGQMGQNRLACNQPVDLTLQTFHTAELASSSTFGLQTRISTFITLHMP